tara:strand:- start:3628 stop:4518 length:891 start_codon:yes stop_codon:yes gene_type:complete
MIKNIHVFGANTLTGEFLISELKIKIPNLKIIDYSRRNKNSFFIDLENDEYKILCPKEDHLIINIAPIWIFADFFYKAFNKDPLVLNKLKGVITCSSSSVITKKKSRNKFDKDLLIKLNNAEKKLENICNKNNILLTIVRPTLIYGKSINKVDKNINFILRILRITPLIIFPRNSGLRQPIHAKQLSEVLVSLTLKTINKDFNKVYIVNVGGDIEINYLEMINRIRSELGTNDPAKKFIILKIPNKLFFLLLYPINIFSPRIYGVILRLGSNLSGFTKASQITGKGIKGFPISPYF